MQDEWFVRVHGNEYGPVDLDALHEWRAEGRLIRENELRRGTDGLWIPAGQVEELFPKELPGSEHNGLLRRRTLTQVAADSFAIYRRGFLPLFGLAVLLAVPSFLMKVSLAYVHAPENGAPTSGSIAASLSALALLLFIFLAWPVFLAALQFATADLLAGQAVRFSNLVSRAAQIWPRMMKLSIAVYGSFFFWAVLPVLAIFALIGGEPSAISLLIAMFALAFQVYMAGRLFVNFLFWQQSATLGGLAGVDALRDSKELARSRSDAPRLQRPLHRGAIVASVWMLVLFAASAAVELPFLIVRMQGITTVEQMTVMVQNLFNASAPDALTLGSYLLSSLVHALLRPLLGVAFVLLYLDSKTTR